MESSNIEHLDVVIIGAGISGIAAAVELRRSCPNKSLAILDMRENMGGTWDLFRYPGIRSDSDMYTLGYSFKPWTDSKAIASGAAILDYLRDTATEFGIDPYLRLGTRLDTASWDSETARWTLSLSTSAGPRTITTTFLYMASGYYRYSAGFNPPMAGEEQFAGTIVHPQHWPEDLDHSGKKVAVIGSGATAITLVPSLADTAEHVTMIQRSPTYLATEANVDEEADRLRAEVGPEEAFRRVRLRNLANQQALYARARNNPDEYKSELFSAIEEFVGPEVREKHFTPTYAPWDQRVCFVPDGDLFHAIRDGKADIATGSIETFTASGIELTNGEHIDADIIVKATGLEMAVAGEAEFFVDGERVDFSKTLTYKGLAYEDVPNTVYAFGFLNSSWTLRIELVNKYWVRILQRMDDLGAKSFTPRLRHEDRDATTEPFISDVNSGYFKRGLPRMPLQGHAPWINPQNYDHTQTMLDTDPQDDVLQYQK